MHERVGLLLHAIWLQLGVPPVHMSLAIVRTEKEAAAGPIFLSRLETEVPFQLFTTATVFVTSEQYRFDDQEPILD
jgi:hypothetical protein